MHITFLKMFRSSTWILKMCRVDRELHFFYDPRSCFCWILNYLILITLNKELGGLKPSYSQQISVLLWAPKTVELIVENSISYKQKKLLLSVMQLVLYSLSGTHGRMCHPAGKVLIHVEIGGMELGASTHVSFLCKSSPILRCYCAFCVFLSLIHSFPISAHYRASIWVVSYPQTSKNYLNCGPCWFSISICLFFPVYETTLDLNHLNFFPLEQLSTSTLFSYYFLISYYILIFYNIYLEDKHST